MLVCKWWFPNKEDPHSVVDAIYLTRAEPTKHGVRVSVKLQFQAQSDVVVGDEGFRFQRHQSFELAGQEVTDALRYIETGENAFFRYLNKNRESKAKVASILPQLYVLIEKPEIDAATGAGNVELVRPPTKRL